MRALRPDSSEFWCLDGLSSPVFMFETRSKARPPTRCVCDPSPELFYTRPTSPAHRSKFGPRSLAPKPCKATTLHISRVVYAHGNLCAHCVRTQAPWRSSRSNPSTCLEGASESHAKTHSIPPGRSAATKSGQPGPRGHHQKPRHPAEPPRPPCVLTSPAGANCVGRQ